MKSKVIYVVEKKKRNGTYVPVQAHLSKRKAYHSRECWAYDYMGTWFRVQEYAPKKKTFKKKYDGPNW